MSDLITRLGESRVYTFDYSAQPEIQVGDTIATITSVVLTRQSGTGTLPTASGSAIATNKQQITALITTAADGSIGSVGSYLAKSLIVTTAGAQLACEGTLVVTP